MSRNPTIVERIEWVDEAVCGWRHLSRYSNLAQLKRFHDLTACVDTTEIISAYERNQEAERFIHDPAKAEEIKHLGDNDIDRARKVEIALREHGQHVAVWLVQQQVPDAEVLTLFLKYRTPKYAERAEHALTIALTYARAMQDKKRRALAAYRDRKKKERARKRFEYERRIAAEQGVEEAMPTTEPLSLCRVGEMWHFRYYDERGDYPVKGNRFIGWLAKLLAQPNKNLTVADLFGDPERKLAADAQLGGETEADRTFLKSRYKRMEEIQAIIEDTGGSEALEDEYTTLCEQVDMCSGKMKTSVKKAYNNITTQKRQFMKKLKKDMPLLTTHLKASLLSFGNDYTVCYRPPANTPNWMVENPSA